MTRRTELAVGAIAIGSAVTFVAAVFVWRTVYDDEPLVFPPLPQMDQWGAFNLYPWLALACYLALAAIIITASIRREGHWIAPCLALVLSFGTAILYVPFWFMRAEGIDRLRGPIELPLISVQRLVATAIVTLALSVGLVVITRLRRTPITTAGSALVTVLFVNAGLLNLYPTLMFAPFAYEWRAYDRQRADLLVPVRPCRGAILWGFHRNRYFDVGVIDDIWPHFADPRNGNAPTFAVSMRGEWQRGYYWLNSSDLVPFRIRTDDPAVVKCDARTRQERVAPAQWHKLGFEW